MIDLTKHKKSKHRSYDLPGILLLKNRTTGTDPEISTILILTQPNPPRISPLHPKLAHPSPKGPGESRSRICLSAGGIHSSAIIGDK